MPPQQTFMATPKTEVAAQPQQPQHQTLTKWEALRGFTPVEIICATYPPYHKVDISCHTRLRFDVEQIKRHVEADHGGGLMIKLKSSDKPVEYWQKFSTADLESVDFRCEVCDKQVPFHPNHIATHMRAHTGKTRRLREGGYFNLTLRIGASAMSEADAFEQGG
jgi:hypothetical protein